MRNHARNSGEVSVEMEIESQIQTKRHRPLAVSQLLFVPIVACVFVLGGCDSSTAPAPLPSGATLEVHEIAGPDAANTIFLEDPNLGAPIALELVPIINSGDVATVELSKLEIESAGGSSGISQPALQIELTPEGAVKMRKATTRLQGQNIAVVINGEIVSTPRVVVPIQGSFRMTGDLKDQPFVDAIRSITGHKP